MPLSIYTAQIPALITWFNGFIGFRELQKRAERVEAKSKDVGMIVPSLGRRYFFHSTYLALAIRNRTFGRIDIHESYNQRAVSLVAAVKRFASLLNPIQQQRLRSRILGYLDPDSDIREFEHEMRALVHYEAAGCKIVPIDDGTEGGFDFLVESDRGQFELECKTFAEDIGNPISVDDSIRVFRVFKSAIFAQADFRDSGILTLTFPKRMTISVPNLNQALSDFLSRGPAEKRCDEYTLTFEKRPEWDAFLGAGGRQAVLDDIATRFAGHNRHSMTMLSRQIAIMGVVRSERRSQPARAIFERLKSASGQFSGRLPAVVWGHFLGFGEEEFKMLMDDPHRDRRPLDVFGRYLFNNPKRDFVCRLRLSVDESTDNSVAQSSRLITRPMIRGGGLAYDVTSRVSKFDPASTQ